MQGARPKVVLEDEGQLWIAKFNRTDDPWNHAREHAMCVERRDLALTVGDFGRYANVNNLLSQCARFLLTRAEAARIIDAMEDQVRARWYAVAEASELRNETVRPSLATLRMRDCAYSRSERR